mmetsp:Transcript_15497/g.40123  ORF Transcript_15497/g.40123 Transcript_15497/m.40123 type:complete len:422 (+) Transcript_15497:213-1478(+)
MSPLSASVWGAALLLVFLPTAHGQEALDDYTQLTPTGCCRGATSDGDSILVEPVADAELCAVRCNEETECGGFELFATSPQQAERSCRLKAIDNISHTEAVDNCQCFIRNSASLAPTAPTAAPTVAPTPTPTTLSPTQLPTFVPTSTPSTAAPSSASPTDAPTEAPTHLPTVGPTAAPTAAPTAVPTIPPSTSPTAAPTVARTATPTTAPPITSSPTTAPAGASASGSGSGGSGNGLVVAVAAVGAVGVVAAFVAVGLGRRRRRQQRGLRPKTPTVENANVWPCSIPSNTSPPPPPPLYYSIEGAPQKEDDQRHGGAPQTIVYSSPAHPGGGGDKDAVEYTTPGEVPGALYSVSTSRRTGADPDYAKPTAGGEPVYEAAPPHALVAGPGDYVVPAGISPSLARPTDYVAPIDVHPRFESML